MRFRPPDLLLAAALLAAAPMAEAAVVTADFLAPGDVAVSADHFDATGNTVAITLGFVPVPGTALTVVEITGSASINGRFDNLDHGQEVFLTREGVTYGFLANYHGGNGNDLVLEWAYRELVAWGDNRQGQIGNASTFSRSSPVLVTSSGVLQGRRVHSVSAGGGHSLALCTDGTVAAWGDNAEGQLGDGTTTDRLSPVAVNASGLLAGRTVVAVSAGNLHSLALCSDGTIVGWGSDSYNQLGPGHTFRSLLPVLVEDGTGALAGRTAIAISAGERHCLALCSDGTVVAWGSGTSGRLGNGGTSQSNPVEVDATGALAGRAVIAVSAGGSHSLALCSDGTVAAWGNNTSGQLGKPGGGGSSVPLLVEGTGLPPSHFIEAIAAGSSHSLALGTDGLLTAWGGNSSGQLGDGSHSQRISPTPVDLAAAFAGVPATAVASTKDHVLALSADGLAAAWGDNDYGNLGLGFTSLDESMPALVSSTGVLAGRRGMAVAAGGGHALALVALPAPRMAVREESGPTLPSGSSLDFGDTMVAGGRTERHVLVENIGGAALGISVPVIEGPDADAFHLLREFSQPIPGITGGGGRLLSLRFSPGRSGPHHATLRFSSLQPMAPEPHVIPLTGSGGSVTSVEVDFSSGNEIGLTLAGLDATGLTISPTLSHAPNPGRPLRLVEVTGLGFIEGEFAGLAHGQEIVLMHEGEAYRFRVDYYGGSGNDLVLHSTHQRVAAWGRNVYGQIGNGSTSDSNVPRLSGELGGLLATRSVASLAMGGDHCLALTSDGTLVSWGRNSYGELGNNTTDISAIPVPVDTSGVLAGRTVVAVAAVRNRSFALCSDGTVAAWGDGGSGGLGNRSSTSRSAPVQVYADGVLTGRKVVAISAGTNHCLALCSDGTLAAWGYNGEDGLLGDNSTSTRNEPVEVDPSGLLAGRRTIAISANLTHSLALCSDGSILAWGGNDSGELGTTVSRSRVPVLVDASGILAGRQVTDIAAGSGHSLALCSDGVLTAWGHNSVGELGNGTTLSTSTPTAVDQSGVLAGREIASIAAGGSFSLALCTDGFLASWGYNFSGSLGDGTTTNRSVPFPVDAGGVLASGRVVGLSASSETGACLIATHPARMAMDAGPERPLPRGGALVFESPPVRGGTTRLPIYIENVGGFQLEVAAMEISGPDADSFLLTPPASRWIESGSRVFMGTITFDPIHNGAHSALLAISSNDPSSAVPHTVSLAGVAGTATTLPVTYLDGSETALEVGGLNATGISLEATLGFAPTPGTRLTLANVTDLDFIAGEFENITHGQEVMLPYSGQNFRFIANYYGGDGNDLVLEWAYNLPITWGANGDGQLGTGSTTDSPVPATVDIGGFLNSRRVTAVSAGAFHNLALCRDGSITSWGYNAFGQLGNGGSASRSAPVGVDMTGVLAARIPIAISAGGFHSLVLCADGVVAAWGSNASGQVGDGSTVVDWRTPSLVDATGVLAARKVVAVAAGRRHSLALCSDGRVATWGYALSRVPDLVDNSGALIDERVVAIAAGDYHSLALKADGTVAAWGSNESGQLGYATTSSKSQAPVLVEASGILSGRKVVAIAAGAAHSLALCSDGALVAWGQNSHGQLGDGSGITDTPSPVLVDKSQILGGREITRIAASGNQSFALCADGTLASWGSNVLGQLGDGTYADQGTPVAVETAGSLAGTHPVTVSGGAAHGLTIAATLPPRVMVETETDPPLSHSGTIDFGSTAVPGARNQKRLLVSNAGGFPLEVGNLNLSGPDAALFHLTPQTLSTIPPGQRYTLATITFAPEDSGLHEAFLSIPTNDPAITEPFVLRLVGSGGGSSILAVDFVTGKEVGLVAGALRATGNSLIPSLGHIPKPGTELRLVNLTGLDLIEGRFDNIAQGQLLPLDFNGETYRFVANYYGGSGNDLVLTWVDTLPAAWGANAFGQLGDGSITNSAFPILSNEGEPLAQTAIISMAAGSQHSLAVLSDGSVAAWGRNASGQLGDTSRMLRLLPVPVHATGALAGKTVIRCVAGDAHSLALCADGSVAAWGSNAHGELAQPSSTPDATAPTLVPHEGLFSAVAAGHRHNLALRTDGTIWSWGLNTSGQLGIGFKSPMVMIPTRADRGALRYRRVIAVAAGMDHSAAICDDGTIATWGRGDTGQLGVSGLSGASDPVEVPREGNLAGKIPVAVAAGGSHCLLLCSDGSLFTWGSNSHGQLGAGAIGELSPNPVPVDRSGVLATREIVAISAGLRHSMVQCSDGSIVTWGDNALGQSGNGVVATSDLPALLDPKILIPQALLVYAYTGPSASHGLAVVSSSDGPGIVVRRADGSIQPNGGPRVEFQLGPGEAETSMEFTVTNSGNVPVSDLMFVFSGADGSSFSSASPSSFALAPGQSVPFDVTFSSPRVGVHGAVLQLVSDTGNDAASYTMPLFGRRLSALEAWRLENFGTFLDTAEGADLSDPNRDGEANLLEFSTGQSPAEFQRTDFNVSSSEDGIVFTYSRSVAALAAVDFIVEWSDSLSFEMWDARDTTETILSDNGATQRVSVSVPLNPDGHRYVRLKVTPR